MPRVRRWRLQFGQEIVKACGSLPFPKVCCKIGKNSFEIGGGTAGGRPAACPRGRSATRGKRASRETSAPHHLRRSAGSFPAKFLQSRYRVRSPSICPETWPQGRLRRGQAKAMHTPAIWIVRCFIRSPPDSRIFLSPAIQWPSARIECTHSRTACLSCAVVGSDQGQ